MKPLWISGIGLICARGRGLEKFEAALKEGWKDPSVSKEGRSAYRIAPEDLTDRQSLERVKRADRFGKMAVLAAYDAVRDSGLSMEEMRKTTGIITATALGPHASVFKFLDGIIDYGESKVSPTTFAHSVHNASSAYVAAALETRGPVMTVTQFYFSLHQALLMAYSWMAEKRVERVLVGIIDECSPAMEYICSEKLRTAPDGKMNPLSFSEKPAFVPGESGVFFLLSLNPKDSKHGCFSEIHIGRQNRGWDEADVSILTGNAMAGSEAPDRNLFPHDAELASYTPLYGGMMSGGALESAAAVLMLKNQVRYPSPLFDKIEAPHPQSLRVVQCMSRNCEGEYAFLKIMKTNP